MLSVSVLKIFRYGSVALTGHSKICEILMESLM